VNYLAKISSNLQADYGRLAAANLIAKTTSLAKFQILQQAQIAKLLQANNSEQNVLILLPG